MVFVSAEPDDSRSIGHARIIIEGLTAPPADPAFRIIREGYPTPNLGRRGWQVAEERLKPVATLNEGGRVVLVVGPSVTTYLEVEPYLFALPEAGVEAALFWPDTIDIFDGPIPEGPEMPADDPPPPSPAPRPARPDADATVIQRLPIAEPAPAPPPPAPPPPPPPAPKPPINGGGGSKVPLILGAVLALLLAAGGATWWVMSQPTPPPVPPPTPTPAPSPAPSPPPAPPTPPPPPAPVWPDGTDALSPADIAARAPNPAGITAVAQRRLDAGKFDDAIPLFEEAAARGDTQAMMAMARMLDPNSFQPGRGFRNPDPRAAARYYRDAARAGEPTAEAARATLRTWLEQQAAAGNANAASYLREFWP